MLSVGGEPITGRLLGSDLGEQSFNFLQQDREFLFDDVPNDRWFDQIVSMTEDVPEVDDAPIVGDSLR